MLLLKTLEIHIIITKYNILKMSHRIEHTQYFVKKQFFVTQCSPKKYHFEYSMLSGCSLVI